MKYLLILIIILSSQIFPQDKYFIYFTDKGNQSSESLNKSSASYLQAVQELMPKAIERRIKNMGTEFITYEDLPIKDDYVNELESLNIQIVRKLKWFNSVSAYLTSDQIQIVKSLPFVKKIEPVKKLFFEKNPELIAYKSSFIPTDTSYKYGPSFSQVNLSDIPYVHSKKIDGKNVLIGILDSGFDWKRHNALKDRNVIAEYDFIFNDSVTANQIEDAPGQDSHGTYVFSILAGFADSILIGPAFNASFILAKTEDIRSETHIEEDNYAAALSWMESFGVDITTSSLGYNIFDSGYSYTYQDLNGRTTIVSKAVDLAYQRGVSTFTAAGNEGNNASWGGYIIAPADAFHIISIGAVNSAGNLAGFSSHGPTSDNRIKPEVVAQGVDVYGAAAGTINGYGFNSGTSAATPIASGVAALLLAAHPYLKNNQIRSIILETSSNTDNPNNQIGYGIISAKKAIEFPNLKTINNNYYLCKTIFKEDIIPESVKANFIYSNNSVEDYPMARVGVYDYELTLPQKFDGEIIKFYITYSDSQNNSFRLPAANEYKFIYGSEIIALNLEVESPQTDYQISDFYPNPFIPAKHKYTRMNYRSSGKELFKLMLIDGSGQKVMEISTLTLPGTNYFEWDGHSDRGYLCASGVYYALVQLGGIEFGKKLVLIK